MSSSGKDNGSTEAVPDSTASQAETRDRASTSTSGRLRAVSQSIMNYNPPRGMWSATGIVAAQTPSIADIRSGNYGNSGWDGEGQRRNSTIAESRRRTSSASQSSYLPPASLTRTKSPTIPSRVVEGDGEDAFPDFAFGRGEMSNQAFDRSSKKTGSPSRNDMEVDDAMDDDMEEIDPRERRKSKNIKAMLGDSPDDHLTAPGMAATEKPVPNEQGFYPNGYHFPAKKTWSEATVIGLRAFWRFTCTPLGFLIVLYGLNVVAWGGMLFLLLCNAAPAMCHLGDGRHDCSDINSPRRIWIETDSQILNGLFCVTGFGLIPWRFRDLYYLMKFRVGKQEAALRRLAGFHNGWFRLPGSELLPAVPREEIASFNVRSEVTNPALPLPLDKAPAPPLTGVRAPSTPLWKMDFVIWAFVANTALQVVLACFMWALNRYNRPSWSTGLFVALACIVAACGGLMQFQEGKRIKKIEGIPVQTQELLTDAEAGWNGPNLGPTEKGTA